MKRILAVVFCVFPAYLLANDTYDPATGIVHMPNVKVGETNFEVNLQHQGDLVFSVASADPIIMPERFSMEWLNGKTLYDVWYGGGFDSYGNDMDGDVPVVAKIVFEADGTAIVTGLLNYQNETLTYDVDSNGGLYFDGDPSLIAVVCGSTSQYLRADFYENGETSPETRNAFFFTEEDAMNAAKLISGISPCS
ncbi:hypothetical protein G3480_26400 [Thiorhodococcus mannitoliphagus]|uniref:Uncharacterized protein n=1 Tax=Thiorhodococcus mannitoliphagus TaxID=329406 RepID=A0A6P1E3U6_9GAMM|nr:hypothetical protein [Thiorhodococcus mannitoliphagus]NEX23753.1 hypothetical protein [Thiorhodococcus mannitoliphagus]